jgi:putative pyruvate formate lyase activating enzyme
MPHGAIQLAVPRYLSLSGSELHDRVGRAKDLLQPCMVCPRECRVKRLDDQRGVCKTGSRAAVSSFNPHFGEEDPLVGRGGSGTIFFSHCNLKCIFCQNYEISQLGEGEELEPSSVASIMLYLQRLGCENINFVSPTHVVPQILEPLSIAIPQGLHIPLVYNTGGYDSVETLKLLDGIIDIYMPDMKYSLDEVSERLSGVADYVSINRDALREMHRQVGDLQIEDSGVASSGLLVRHLVLPEGLSGTEETTRFLAEEISKDTYINVMDQYRPCYRSEEIPEIARRLTDAEYREAVEIARGNGLHRFDSPARRRFFPL